MIDGPSRVSLLGGPSLAATSNDSVFIFCAATNSLKLCALLAPLVDFVKAVPAKFFDAFK